MYVHTDVVYIHTIAHIVMPRTVRFYDAISRSDLLMRDSRFQIIFPCKM